MRVSRAERTASSEAAWWELLVAIDRQIDSELSCQRLVREPDYVVNRTTARDQ
jgi:hypothetical protein